MDNESRPRARAALRRGIPIGRIFGISVDLDYSWFLIVGLITWALAASYYPAEFPHRSAGEYWLLGLATALLLFLSVLIHELGHSIVARRFGLSVRRITLLIFGGVSQITAEPPSAGAEFWIAVTGPVVSFALGAMLWALAPALAGSAPLFAVTKYLAFLNITLGVFNLVPGFPLDGGRVFRAAIWHFSGDYQRATAVAAATGRFFGFLLIFLGAWQVFSANVTGGLWIAFIGWFLESAAASELRQETLKQLLGVHPVRDAMRRDFPQVSGTATLQELVDRYILPGGARYLVVTDAGGSPGMVTLAMLRAVPRAEWATTTAAQVMVPLQRLATTPPDATVWSALEEMGRDGVNQLLVVDGARVVGGLARDDILHYLNILEAVGPVAARYTPGGNGMAGRPTT